MSLDLYREYCDNIGCDLVIVDKDNKHIQSLVLPRDDTNFLKIGTIMEAAESNYDKIVFADIDILVDPNYKDMFDNIDLASIYINGFFGDRNTVEKWTTDKKGGCNIIWPYYKYRYADNFYGFKKEKGITSWNTCHSMSSEWCRGFIDFLSDVDLLPVNNENANNISKLCTIDGEETFMTDEILIELFLDQYGGYFKEITWPHRSHYEDCKSEDFMIDFWNVESENMENVMKPWYQKLKNIGEP